MRAIKVLTVICWLIAAIALTGLAIWFMTGTIFGIGSARWNNEEGGRNVPFGVNIGNWEALTGPFEIDGVYNIGTDGVKSISIDWVAGEITVKPYDGDDVKITEYAQRKLSSDEKIHIANYGSTINLKYREKNNWTNMPRKKLEVLIPRSLCDNLHSLQIDSISGSVNADEITAEIFRVETTSGSIHIGDISSEKFTLNSISGSITATSVSADDMKIESSSGSVHVNSSSAKTLDCETISGSISVNGSFDWTKLNSTSGRQSLDNSAHASTLYVETISGSQELSGSFSSVKLDSSSGSIKITSTIVPSSLHVEAISGGVTITVPGGEPVTVRQSTISGRFSSDIPVILQNGESQFNISTTSGSIRIYALG